MDFSRSPVEALLSADTRTGERRIESELSSLSCTSKALGATTCPFLLADEGIVISLSLSALTNLSKRSPNIGDVKFSAIWHGAVPFRATKTEECRFQH